MAAHLNQEVMPFARTVKVYSATVDDGVRADGPDLRGGVEHLGERTAAEA
jgi:hypothetical protein